MRKTLTVCPTLARNLSDRQLYNTGLYPPLGQSCKSVGLENFHEVSLVSLKPSFFREKTYFSPFHPFKNRGARGRRGAHHAVFSQPRRRGVPEGDVGAGNRPMGLRNHERASEAVR
jgi:hypothetical protein